MQNIIEQFNKYDDREDAIEVEDEVEGEVEVEVEDEVDEEIEGLVDAVGHIFPNANVRNCIRHIYNNFKVLHKGKALKDGVWKAARATYVREFEDAMEQLKVLSVPAYNWLHKLNPAQWFRSHLDTRTKCDMLLNNICESFNKKTTRKTSKKRKREADEVVNPKLSKKGQQANCTKCGKTGHNKRTCRGEVGANQPIRRPPPSFRQQQPERHPSSSQDQQPRRHPSSSQEQQPGRHPSSSQDQQPGRHPSSSQEQQPGRHPSSSLSPPTVVRWMCNASSSQQSTISNPPNQESQASTRE
ncbi:hypothetical protein V6N13_041351 [Hibiscus sabdariffa]